MGLSGRQTNNPGFSEAQAYVNDPDNANVPDAFHYEQDMGHTAFILQQIEGLQTDAVNFPTTDQKAALDAATTPNGTNAFATIEDLASFSSPTSFFYDFDDTAGTPASGVIRMDNADPAVATVVRIHNLNRNGANVSNFLMKMTTNDALILQDNLESDKVYNFDVSGNPTQVGGTGASGYVEIPVSLFSQGSTALTSTDVIVAGVYQDGNNSSFLKVNSNLSDVQNAATARANIGLGSTDAVFFGPATEIGDTEYYNGNIELNRNGSGDRTAFLDFWSHDATADFDARIIRGGGVNADLAIENKGTGNIRFDGLNGGNFIFNPSSFDSDFRVNGDDVSHFLFWDASLGRLGINASSPEFPLHVNGESRLGDTRIGAGYVELNIDASGDSSTYIDFWAHGAASDYDARIIRTAGENADFNFQNRGSGKFRFWNENDGGGFEFNSQLNNNDWAAYGTLSNRNIYFDADTGRFGINDTTPSYTLDVNGDARFVSGLKTTTIDSTNSIDGAALQDDTVPSDALGAYGVYRNSINQTALIAGEYTTQLLGTRIDVSSGDYLSSSFMFHGVQTLADYTTSGGQSYIVNFSIKKASGSQPFASFHVTYVSAGTTANHTVYSGHGLLSVSGGSLTQQSPLDTRTVEIQRVDTNNELAFRFRFDNITTSGRNFDESGHFLGNKYFAGTDITSSVGTPY